MNDTINGAHERELPTPAAWASTNRLTEKTRYDALPVQSLQPGLMTHERLYTAEQMRAAQVSSKDAKDAARYRWLREQCQSPGVLTIAKSNGYSLEGWSGDDPDGAIDTARAALSQQGVVS